MASGEVVLLVEDDERAVRTYTQLLALGCGVVVTAAGGVAEARAIVERAGPLRAAIVDIGLPDGSGMDLVEWLRERRPELPILVLTAYCNPDLVRRAHEARAAYLPKPSSVENLIFFIDMARLRGGLEERLAHAIQDFVRRHGLAAMEGVMLQLAMTRRTQKEIADASPIDLGTVRNHVRSILHKCGAQSLDEVVSQLWRAAESDEAAPGQVA